MRAARRVISLVPLLIAVGALAAVAHAFGLDVLSTTAEIHGKPTIKLTEAFSIRFPEGATGVAWSPDGSVLGASTDYGMRLNTYDAAGHQRTTFKSGGITGMAYFNSFSFINGSSEVLFPLEDSTNHSAALDIRDVGTGQILQKITRDRNPIRANFPAASPDQSRFAIANDYGKEVVSYGRGDGTEWRELSISPVAITHADHGKEFWHGIVSMSFFPDGKRLAVGKNEGYFAVVDSTTGKTVREFRSYDAPGVDQNVQAIAASPGGDEILTGLEGIAMKPDLSPQSMAWYLSDHDVVSIWRISDGARIAGFPDKGKAVTRAVWDPKDRFVAFIDRDALFVWQFAVGGQPFIRIPLPGVVTSLAVTRDGKRLAVAGGNKVIVYNIQNVQE